MFNEEDPVLPGDILKILRDLGVGLVNHSNWLKRLHREIICNGEIPVDDLAENAHQRCEFGKWYYKTVDSRLRGLPLFEEVGVLHQRVHQAARHLLKLRTSGTEITAPDYDKFMDVAHEFRVGVQNLQFSMFSQVCAIDHLTGVWNRYALVFKLAQEQERVRRSGRPCAVAIIDFDHFKKINDRHGHLAGDQVLQEAIHFCNGKMRKYDLVFRFGGEEFLFAFPDTDLEMAQDLLERLREGLKALPIRVSSGEVLNVTVSIGLAMMHEESGERDVIALADNALMNAKLGGRDRICVWRQ